MCDSFANLYYCGPQPPTVLPCNNNVPSIYIPQGTVPIFSDLKWEILSAFLLEIKNDKNVQAIINELYQVYLQTGLSSDLTPLIEAFILEVTPLLTKFAAQYPNYDFICTLNEGNVLYTFNDSNSNFCIASSSGFSLSELFAIISFRTSARTAPANFISAANSNFGEPFATVAIGVAPIATYNTNCQTDLLTTLTGAVLRLIVVPTGFGFAPGVATADFKPSKIMELLKPKPN
jgi:hypothetical protein